MHTCASNAVGGAPGTIETMGTWGAGIFADDIAADVRDDWRDHVGEGMTGPQATDATLAEWSEALGDPASAPVVWLALAATQARTGRLEDRVRDRAVEVIDAGDDMPRWADDARLQKQRAAILAKLRADLLGPQRPPTRVPKPIRSVWPWESGSVVAYRRDDGRLNLVRVLGTVGTHGVSGGRSGILELLDWIGASPPPVDVVDALPPRAPVDWTAASPQPFGVLVLDQRQLDRWFAVVERTRQSRWFMHTLINGRQVDGFLQRRYGF